MGKARRTRQGIQRERRCRKRQNQVLREGIAQESKAREWGKGAARRYVVNKTIQYDVNKTKPHAVRKIKPYGAKKAGYFRHGEMMQK